MPICWHNGRPMGRHTAAVLRNQVEVLELGERVAIFEALRTLR
jgi:hypothetical protein